MIYDICGMKCVSGNDAFTAFRANYDELRKYRRQGLPHFKVGRTIYFPLDLCHRWFAGESLKQEKATLANKIHEAFKMPKEEWITEVKP